MASLKLVVDDFSEDTDQQAVDRRAFAILSDYLQPDSKTPLATAAPLILNLFPAKEEDPRARESAISSLSGLCVDVADQIPYSHLSQMKLARLLQQVAQSPRAITQSVPLRPLSVYIRDNLDALDEKNSTTWVNFHSFVARVEALVWPGDPTWAIWAMRNAFEQDDEFYPSGTIRDTYVLAAAQYILFRGQDLAQRVLCPGVVSDHNRRCWLPGPKYSGAGDLDLARWVYWKDGFRAVAAYGKSDEVKGVAAKTLTLMEALSMPGFEES